MPRLIHLANYPNLHAGSYIPWLLAVFDEAIERGWSTEAGFPDEVKGAEWVDEFHGRGIDLHWIPPGGRASHVRDVAAIVGSNPSPTVIHTHFTSFDIPAALAARRRRNIHVFWHIHTVLEDDPITIARHAAKFVLFGRRVDRIFVPAANIGDGLARRFARRDRIELMPSAIDPSAYLPPTPGNRIRARAELEASDDAWVLLHIGRAWKLKGGPAFLAAAKILVERGRPVVAATLRGGPEADREGARLGIGALTRNLGRVRDIRDLYAAADCFVAPSEGEGMPFSIVEALASGVPVVASDLPGHRFLGDPLEACTIVSREPADIADAIEALMSRPTDVAAREADEARDWISGNLSLAVTASQLLDSYERALAEPA